MTISTNIYPDLDQIKKLVFQACGLDFSNFETEEESQEYAACSFTLDRQHVKFRKAKITPTKIGQFVTIWKRNEKATTQPFDISDDIDFYLIAARQQNQFGLFIFTKSVLYNHKILSDKTRDGKRGIRVYPTWDLPTNKQAQKTQQWQTRYFLEVSQNKLIDLKKAKLLFNIHS
ncbi:MAG: MepB family protein [Bacteroidota bacterium]